MPLLSLQDPRIAVRKERLSFQGLLGTQHSLPQRVIQGHMAGHISTLTLTCSLQEGKDYVHYILLQG